MKKSTHVNTNDVASPVYKVAGAGDGHAAPEDPPRVDLLAAVLVIAVLVRVVVLGVLQHVVVVGTRLCVAKDFVRVSNLLEFLCGIFGLVLVRVTAWE